LRFRGWAFSTNVQSCLWNSHKTQRRSSCNTHLLFRRRHPSQGRSRRGREGAVCWICLRAGRESLFSIKRCLGGDQAAMSREQGLGASGWTAITVAMVAVRGVYMRSEVTSFVDIKRGRHVPGPAYSGLYSQGDWLDDPRRWLYGLADRKTRRQAQAVVDRAWSIPMSGFDG
jgi:hypothetical protein